MSFYSRDTSGQLWKIDVNTDGSLQTTAISVGPTTGTSVSTPSLTGTSLVKSALRKLGAITSGETLKAAELADGLEALNSMLDAWNADNLMVYSAARETFALTIGLNPHGIGIGSDLSTTRPKDISLAYIQLSDGTEVPVAIITQDKYAAIPQKTIAGQPIALYYDSNFANGNVYLYYVPDQAYTLILYNLRPLQQVDGTTAFSLPNGYAEAIKWNLALKLSPEYGKGSDKALGVIASQAALSKAEIERANYKPVSLNSEEAQMNGNTSGFIVRNIKAGGWF